MYNRYIPSDDGTYRRQRVETDAASGPPAGSPPAPMPPAPRPPQPSPPRDSSRLDTDELLLVVILML